MKFFLLINLTFLSGFQTFSFQSNSLYKSRIDSSTRLYESIIDKLVNKFGPKVIEEEKSEDDELLEYLQEKPWKAPKIKQLTIQYRPWKDSYKERYRTEDDETIYLYSIPEYKNCFETTRVDEAWIFPWLWTKLKVERLSYIQKQFLVDADYTSVQEFMEMDNFFAEFDMPIRWGILRMREFDVLNMISFLVCYNTDFNGIKPTDLGLRPDGTVRVCPVQFHNCLSSSNNPLDTEHYAAPFKWSRSKSPDQAYEEIKSVYFKYPKRGLRWTNGWIDRGGWKPQQFSGPYFYAQAESLIWHFTDDIELVLDNEKREVQYRSQMRLGQTDWDVQRLRYNQFTRMLQSKGGWEVYPMERLHWMGTTPFRWTELILDKALLTVEQTLDTAASTAMSVRDTLIGVSSGSGSDGQQQPLDSTITSVEGAAQRLVNELLEFIQPVIEVLQPYTDQLYTVQQQLVSDPSLQQLIQEIQNFEKTSTTTLNNLVQPITDKVLQALSSTTSSSSTTGGDGSINFRYDPDTIVQKVTQFFEKILPLDNELTRIQKESSRSGSSGNGSGESATSGTTSTTPSSPTAFFEKFIPKSDVFEMTTDTKTTPLNTRGPQDSDGMSIEEQNQFILDQQQQQKRRSSSSSSSSISVRDATLSGTAGSDERTRSAGGREEGVILLDKQDFLRLKQRFLKPVLAPVSITPVTTTTTIISSASSSAISSVSNDDRSSKVSSEEQLSVAVSDDSVTSAMTEAPVPPVPIAIELQQQMPTTTPSSSSSSSTSSPNIAATSTSTSPTTTIASTSTSKKSKQQLQMLKNKFSKSSTSHLKSTVEFVVESMDSSDTDYTGSGKSLFDPSSKSLLMTSSKSTRQQQMQ